MLFSSFPGKQNLRQICVQVVYWRVVLGKILKKNLYKARLGTGRGEVGCSCRIGLSWSHGAFWSLDGFSKLSQIEAEGPGLCFINLSLGPGCSTHFAWRTKLWAPRGLYSQQLRKWEHWLYHSIRNDRFNFLLKRKPACFPFCCRAFAEGRTKSWLKAGLWSCFKSCTLWSWARYLVSLGLNFFDLEIDNNATYL